MTQEEKKIDRLMRVIRALRAKAEGTNNEAEAAAFAAKAAEMMAAHGLEEAQLRVEEQSGIEHVQEVMDWSSPARKLLAINVCRLYMVRSIMPARKGHPWILVGRKHNIIMAREMIEYLIATTLRLSKNWRKENAATGAEMIDFRRGCFDRLAERIREMHDAQVRAQAAQWSPTGNPMNLPALYKQEHRLLVEYSNKRFRTKQTSMRGLRIGDAGMEGRAAGDRVSLNNQVSGGKPSGSLLLGKR